MSTIMNKRRIFLMMATLLLGSFVTTLAETLMNNGLPAIMKETHVNQMSAQWLNTGYMLMSGMMMPLANFIMHRFPLRRIFTVTMTVFLTGLIISATAPNFPILLLGRLIQASAVGINMPLVTNVLTVIIPVEHRGLALGLAGIIINLGPAIGPTLSGVILEYFNWRMLFIILIPIVIITIIATNIWVQNVLKPVAIPVDIPSVILVMFGLGILLYSLGRLGEMGHNFLITMGLIGIGLMALLIFSRRQLKLDNPLLDLHVFQSKHFCLGMTIALLISAAIMAPELILPLFNQNVKKVSALISGLVMIPSALAMAFLSPFAGRLYDDFGIKHLGIFGSLIALLTAVPMFFYDASTSIVLITILYSIRCGDLTLAYTPASVYALNSLSQKQVTSGNTIIVTMVQVANSFSTTLAVAIQGLVQNWQIVHHDSILLAMTRGYQGAFASTILITIIALLLLTRISDAENTSSNDI
ncbi:Multidrug and toxin extrusion (MATE) family efflux pump YdhE/NorM, homolog [Ligilactobacillus acidipiscis]|uniref:Multidrug and toxin extrusion (MATE) family efflux pump YdhE/NorM, homolog n=2 Tax=Ligilactobacillus acidipiscis TaxID=89059 RepID=A0A1K1KQC1_9LACO|nr:Multidrug and toxin extrusion (MATE) family efflux pump YdhE/NorM, homolog [Ligilactobacillus acidipiscis]